MHIAPTTLSWLLEGDPAIRWQVLRDLAGEPEAIWRAERARVAVEGWGAAFLERQLPHGSWPPGRWTGTIWTLLLLLECGISGPLDRLSRAADLQISSLLPHDAPVDQHLLKGRLDLCHLGFWLRAGAAFLPRDGRLPAMAEAIFELQLADGGWNCHIRSRPNVSHSSLHTTFNVLEGLREAAARGIVEPTRFQEAQARAIEFVLAHRLYKSDRTGAVISASMTRLTFPSYWHYTVLRGLDYIQGSPFAADPRLDDALDLLESRRRPNGRWRAEKRVPGTTFFDMEKPGTESRWNTLRALRSLKARA